MKSLKINPDFLNFLTELLTPPPTAFISKNLKKYHIHPPMRAYQSTFNRFFPYVAHRNLNIHELLEFFAVELNRLRFDFECFVDTNAISGVVNCSVEQFAVAET